MPPTPQPTNRPTLLIPDPDTDTLAGLEIVPAKQLTRDAFNALFFGYPGVGKTSIAGMLADYEPARDVLVVDAEGGASVLSHRDHVDVVQVKKWADVEKLLAYFERTPADQLKYKSVCWDNVTELQTMHLQSIIGNAQPEIQHYGRNTAEILRFTRRIRDLSRFKGINTVLIAWQDTKVDKRTNVTRQTVALTDKLAARLPGVLNIVGYVTILNNPPLYTRKLSFAASPVNDAKFRRSAQDDAVPIPMELYYSVEQSPIADMLRTLYEGVPFPAQKYARPKGKTTAQNTEKSTTEDGTSEE